MEHQDLGAIKVKASNLVRIDLEGNPAGHSDWPVNPAGFTVHAAIHAGIPEAHCVMHTHTTAGMAVACSRSGLSMSNFYSAQLHGKLAYHDFEGITVHPEEAPRLLTSIGNRPALILRNETEWSYLVDAGVHVLVGASYQSISAGAQSWLRPDSLEQLRAMPAPLWPGASERACDAIDSFLRQ